MTSDDIYEELSSGKWIHELLKAHVDSGTLGTVQMKCALHFQQLFLAYQEALSEEESTEEAERVRIVEDIESDPTPDKIAQYREQGWRITRRAKNVIDMDGFLRDHMGDLQIESLAVIKTKLPPDMKRELNRYESNAGYSYTVKRSKSSDEE
jgi:hypothetical protein